MTRGEAWADDRQSLYERDFCLWRGSIVEHRQRLRDYFEESPSLRPYAVEVFARAYADARERASAETGLPIRSLPGPAPTLWSRHSIPSSCRG